MTHRLPGFGLGRIRQLGVALHHKDRHVSVKTIFSRRSPTQPRGIAWARLAAALVGLVLLSAIGAWALSLRSEIAPIARPAPDSFSSEQVQRGARLAAVGDCVVCHTAEGGKPFAGGRALATPFGTLYATNLTPDERTGMGHWSLDAFRRAMREGVARNGEHLYPALPYEHFHKIDDEDLAAIYAFLMTRGAVEQRAPRNELIPPLGFRPLLAGWKMLFLRNEPFRPVPARSAEWNRGGYLVEGLGHCGGCHTPRNVLGAEQWKTPFAGGLAEGWDAPALDATNPAADRWNADALYRYLREGAHPEHGVAVGPMGPVAHALGQAAPEDVRAIAVYIDERMHPAGAPSSASLPPQHALPRPIVENIDLAARVQPLGSTVFAGACAGCHATGASMLRAGRAGMADLTALKSDSARNAVMAILSGLRTPTTDERPLMPAYGDTLSDAQIAAVAAYARARYTERPPWPDLERTVAKVRKDRSSP